MPNLKLAKRSAAFEAIKQLHRMGELTDNLMPINRQKCLDLNRDTYFKSWDQFPDGKRFELIIQVISFFSVKIVDKLKFVFLNHLLCR